MKLVFRIFILFLAGIIGLNCIPKKSLQSANSQVPVNNANNRTDSLPPIKNTISDSVVYDTKTHLFKIGVMLPFFKNGNDGSERQLGYRQASLDYYYGVKMGLDSLRALGLNAEIYPEDTELDSSKVGRYISKFKDFDLIIGPAFNSGIKMAHLNSKNTKAKIFLPFENEISANNAQFIYANSGFSGMGIGAANIIGKAYTNAHIIILTGTKAEVRECDSLFQIQLRKVNPNLEITKVDFTNSKVKPLADYLLKTKKNIFFIPIRSEALVNQALSQLRAIEEIEVYGLQEWLEFDNLMVDDWNKINFHLIGKRYVDFSNPSVNHFRKYVLEYFNTEPSEYIYSGFDDICFLGNQLMKHGYYFTSFLNEESCLTPTSGYLFQSDSALKSQVNYYTTHLQYYEKKLTRIF